MGIRGLTSFFNENADACLIDYMLKDTYLVIDGNSLCCQIYKHAIDAFSAFGGDYDVYYYFAKRFFADLKKCNVTAIVIFDGGLESKKLRTVYHRMHQKMELLKNFNRKHWTDVMLPMSTSKVLIGLLEDMDVFHVRCLYEADKEIAAIARLLNCPVLSRDSDFFIFDVLYIPLDLMDMRLREISTEGGDGTSFYMQCKMYSSAHLTEVYDGLDRSVLPLLAAVLGNDYNTNLYFQKFLDSAQIPIKSSKNSTCNRIQKLFLILKTHTLDSAIKLIMASVDEGFHDVALKILQLAIDDYTVGLPYVPPLLTIPEVKNKLQDKKLQQGSDEENIKLFLKLPKKIQDYYYSGKVGGFVMDMISTGKIFLPIQVEDISKGSSHTINFPIISAIYHILTSFSGEKRMLQMNMKWFDNYVSKPLSFFTGRCFLNLDFTSLADESMETRQKGLMMDVLSLDDMEYQSVITHFDGSWLLFAVAVLFWTRKSGDVISKNHVLAVVMMAIANFIETRVGYYKNYTKFMERRAGELNRLMKQEFQVSGNEGSTICQLLENISPLECLLFTQKFIKLRQTDANVVEEGYYMSTIHSFATLQSCLHYLTNLNALMDFPFPQLRIPDFYSGTFLYNCYYLITSKPNGYTFLMDHLRWTTPNVLLAFEFLLSHFNCPSLNVIRIEVPTAKKADKKKRGKKGRKRRG